MIRSSESYELNEEWPLPPQHLLLNVFDKMPDELVPLGFSWEKEYAKVIKNEVSYDLDELSTDSKCEMTSANFRRYVAGNLNVDITNISFGKQKKRLEGFVVPTLTIKNNGDQLITIEGIGCYKTAAQKHVHAPSVFYIPSSANKFYGDGPIPAGGEGVYEASFCFEYGPGDKYTITEAKCRSQIDSSEHACKGSIWLEELLKQMVENKTLEKSDPEICKEDWMSDELRQVMECK